MASIVRAEDSRGFVSVRGSQIVDSKGQAIHLRGTNLGGWLLPEGYMFLFERINAPRQLEDMVAQLIGDQPAKHFWEKWRESYITRDDIRLIKRAGFDSVRVPFSYRLFIENEDVSRMEGPGWERMDRVIGWCRDEGLYVILDMHAAPGGQSGDNIDDSRGYPFLFENEESQTMAVALWKKIAARYKNETTVLGYDLLNEPITPFFDNARLFPRVEPLYKRMVAAIREVDPHHICILAGPGWITDVSVFGKPFAPNLVYTFHAYHEQPTVERLKPYLEFRAKYDVPLWLGESGEDKDEWISAFRQVLEKNDIGWCFWPYKRMGDAACTMTVPTPADWALVKTFAEAPRGTFTEIRKARPKGEAASKALDELLLNVQAAHGRINKGYLEALGLRVP
ncbi:MAG TPA: glycoside hydrolase family 5 protein [Opitutaceae bacterium]|nr:glycoside hydrolase family 5 protein [Opitutaceae bacterium]